MKLVGTVFSSSVMALVNTCVISSLVVKTPDGPSSVGETVEYFVVSVISN